MLESDTELLKYCGKLLHLHLTVTWHNEFYVMSDQTLQLEQKCREWWHIPLFQNLILFY